MKRDWRDLVIDQIHSINNNNNNNNYCFSLSKDIFKIIIARFINDNLTTKYGEKYMYLRDPRDYCIKTNGDSINYGGNIMMSEQNPDHLMIISLWNFTKSLSVSNKMLRNLVLSHIIWQDYYNICNTIFRPDLWYNLRFASAAYGKAKIMNLLKNKKY
jgi:hypothetical protein